MALTLTLALERQRQADLYEFEASLVYRASSKIIRAATVKPCFKKEKKKESISRAGAVAQLEGFCLACVKSWVPSPALHKTRCVWYMPVTPTLTG